MANGQQLAEINFLAFSSWVASKSDIDFLQFVSRGVLSRKQIAIECGINKSAIDQNPRIKSALRTLEDGLRDRKILPAFAVPSSDQEEVPLMRETGKQKIGIDAERLRRLEQENASLRAENVELKRVLASYAILRDALAMTGRVPR